MQISLPVAASCQASHTLSCRSGSRLLMLNFGQPSRDSTCSMRQRAGTTAKLLPSKCVPLDICNNVSHSAKACEHSTAATSRCAAE